MHAAIPSQFSRPRRASRGLLVDRCSAKIVDAIESGQIDRGQRLGEVTLAQMFGIGRAPVRAAFDRLAATGILERRPQSGTYVRNLSLDEHVEMTQVRSTLEAMACRLICGRADAKGLNKLDTLAQRLDRQARIDEGKGGDRVTRINDLELEFHSLIAELSDNRSLIGLLSTQHFIGRYLCCGVELQLPFVASRYASRIPTHCQIVTALQSRDADQAELVMRRHVLVSIYYEVAEQDPTSQALSRISKEVFSLFHHKEPRK